MRIKNLAASTVYMGYESPGFYLKPGAVSDELPETYVANQCLQADAEAGRVEILSDKAKPAAAPVVPPPVVKAAVKVEDKKSVPAREPERKAPEPKPTTTTPTPKVDAPNAVPVNPLKAEITTKVEMIAKPEDKKEYLMDRITGGDGPTAKVAADVLVDLTRKQAEDTKTKTPEPAPAAAGAKPYGTMTKVELIGYALTLGLNATPATDINNLRKMVKEKLEEGK